MPMCILESLIVRRDLLEYILLSTMRLPSGIKGDVRRLKLNTGTAVRGVDQLIKQRHTTRYSRAPD